MKLLSIKLVKAYDNDPEIGFLFGEYSNEWSEKAINTKRDGRYYKYFIPVNDYPEYALQDFKFVEEYERGEHIAYYVYAVAGIETLGVEQKIRTNGLFGYFDEIEKSAYQEELQALKEILLDMGISEEEISKIEPVKVEE